MFHRIRKFGRIAADGRMFRACLYGDPQADGSWAGWVVFFPVPSGVAIAPPSPETTQRTLAALEVWSGAVTVVYLEGALERALHVTEPSPIVATLVDAEGHALADAARLEAAAHLERTAADVDDAAARAARAEAEQIRRERFDIERVLAAMDEQAATADARMHDEAARQAQLAAADATRRRRSAEMKGRSQPRSTRRGGRKA